MSIETTILTPGTNTNPTFLIVNIFHLIELNMVPRELRFILFGYLIIFKFSFLKYKINAITLEYCL